MAEFKCQECGKVLFSEEALQQHTEAKHAKQTPKKQGKSRRYLYIAGAVIIVIVAAAFLMSGKPPEYTPKTEPHDKVMGNESATVTLTEYSDYECPYCANFDRSTEGQIIENYVDTGKVKLVFKNYPLPSHANAQKAAEAAECADDIGGTDMFWTLHEKMFANSELLSVSNLKRYASQIGINMSEFDACIDSGAMRPRIQLDKQDGIKLGVASTPTFFVNDQKIEGAQPYATFQSAIENKLGQVQ